MNDLREKLVYVRNLLLAMQNLNQEEEELQNQLEKTKNMLDVVTRPEVNKKKWIILVVAVFFVIAIVSTNSKVNAFYNTAMRLYEDEKFHDEFYWQVNHSEDEPYPGYDEPEPKKTDSLALAAFMGIFQAAVVAAILGGVITIKYKLNAADTKKQNKQINAQNQKVTEENQVIEKQNEKIFSEIEHIHSRKSRISEEYQKNIVQWFPKDYGYLKAVDYFINLVDNHMATTIQEAVEQYRTYEYQQTMMEGQQIMINNQQTMIRNQNIMIGNQEIMIGNMRVMISNQQELVRQQMLGNLINRANLAVNRENLAVNRATNAAVNGMADDMSSIAYSANKIRRNM